MKKSEMIHNAMLALVESNLTPETKLFVLEVLGDQRGTEEWREKQMEETK